MFIISFKDKIYDYIMMESCNLKTPKYFFRSSFLVINSMEALSYCRYQSILYEYVVRDNYLGSFMMICIGGTNSSQCTKGSFKC